jgi:hypothetical protein
LVLVDHSADDRSSLDPRGGQVGDGIVGPRRSKLMATMRPTPVVVGRILVQHDAAMSVSKDEHAVGGLGPDGTREALGVVVRAGTLRRVLTGLIPASVRTASNAAVNCPARSRTAP